MKSCSSLKTLTVKPGGLLFYLSFDHPGDPVSDGGGDYHYTDEVDGVAMSALFENPFDPQPGYPKSGIISQGTQLGPAGLPDDIANTLVSDLIDIPYDPATVPGISIFGWINVADKAFGFGNGFWIAGVSWFGAGWPIFDSSFWPGIVLYMNSDETHLDLLVYDSVGNPSMVSANFTPSVGAWNFVAGTYDTATKEAKLYINGSTAVATATVNDLGGPFTQGKFGIGVDASEGGRVVDEVGISFEGVFTPAQIAQLYNTGSGLTWPAVNSV